MWLIHVYSFTQLSIAPASLISRSHTNFETDTSLIRHFAIQNHVKHSNPLVDTRKSRELSIARREYNTVIKVYELRCGNLSLVRPHSALGRRCTQTDWLAGPERIPQHTHTPISTTQHSSRQMTKDDSAAVLLSYYLFLCIAMNVIP